MSRLRRVRLFVKVGDQVEVGQVLCIVEAMKLMNEIESDVAGEVVRQIASSGQPVEYGQALFAIRPRSVSRKAGLTPLARSKLALKLPANRFFRRFCAICFVRY